MPWKLLVLEDDANLRNVLADVLAEEGYDVVAVDNGEAAVQLASQQSFDLIVTDIRMDGLDGLQALERARSYQPELSSLVVSGYTTEAETLRALQLNVGGYLKKPFALSDFLQRTRELLQQRRQERERRQSIQRLRQSLWWALDEAAPAGRESGQLALYLARQLGIDAESCQNLRLAALLQGFPRWPSTAHEDTLGLAAPLQWINELKRGQELSLSAQIIRLAHGLSQGEGAPDYPWDARLQPLAASPPTIAQVSAALADHEAELGLRGAQQLRRSLLGLALTLEERGDLASAEGAYLRLIQDPEASPENRLQAQVGLARVMWLGNQTGWYEALKEAERQSRCLGPLAGAAQRWPIATLLLRSGHTSASTYLAQLESELAELGLTVAAAKARLGRALLSPAQSGLSADVQLLLSAGQLGQVAQDSDWLVGALLSLAPQSGVPPGKAWARLICEFPMAVVAWARRAEQAPLEFLLQSLEAWPEQAPPRLLEALQEHAMPMIRARAVSLKGGAQPGVFLRFRSFGDFDVVVNGERVPDKLWKTAKFKWLLAYLVARRGQRVHEEVLVEDFWPNSKGAGKASVYSATTTLRRCLRSGGAEKHEFILRDGEHLSFDPNLACWHDLEEFEQAGQSERAEDWLQAAGLLGGPYLDGCFLDWAVRRRSQLDEAAIRLYTRLAQASLEERPQEALDHAQKALDLDPLIQECHLIRMQAFVKAGQPDRAIKQFGLCEKELRRELGIEPLTSLVEALYRAKLALP